MFWMCRLQTQDRKKKWLFFHVHGKQLTKICSWNTSYFSTALASTLLSRKCETSIASSYLKACRSSQCLNIYNNTNSKSSYPSSQRYSVDLSLYFWTLQYYFSPHTVVRNTQGNTLSLNEKQIRTKDADSETWTQYCKSLSSRTSLT